MKTYLGFSTQTSSPVVRFFCPLFRHVVVVTDGYLIQVGTDGVRIFKCGPREIRLLENAGWVFVEVTSKKETNNPSLRGVAPKADDEAIQLKPINLNTLENFLIGLLRRLRRLAMTELIFLCLPFTCLTCVSFAKRALNIRNPFIWTPDQLFRFIVQNA